MGIKEKLPLLRNGHKIVRLFGYIIYTFVAIIILGAILPSHDNDSSATTTKTVSSASADEEIDCDAVKDELDRARMVYWQNGENYLTTRQSELIDHCGAGREKDYVMPAEQNAELAKEDRASVKPLEERSISSYSENNVLSALNEVSNKPINETLGPYAVSISANGFTVAEKNTSGSTHYLALAESGTKNQLTIGLKAQEKPIDATERYNTLISALTEMAFDLELFKAGVVRNWVDEVDIQGNEAYVGSRNRKFEEVYFTIVAYYPLDDTLLTAIGYFPDEPDNLWGAKSEQRIMDILNDTHVMKV